MSSLRSKEGLALIQELEGSLKEIKQKLNASGEAQLVSSGEGSLDSIFQQIVDTVMSEFNSIPTQDSANPQFADELCELETKLITLLSKWEENKQPQVKELMALFVEVGNISEQVDKIEKKLPKEESKLELECDEATLLSVLKECIIVEEKEAHQSKLQQSKESEEPSNELIFLPSQGKSEILEFNIITKKFKLITSEYIFPADFGICTEGTKTYLVGGRYDRQSDSALDFAFMINTNGALALSPLKKGRHNLALAILEKEEIYATGGETYQRVGLVEKYTIEKDKWEYIKDMNRPHAAHSATGYGAHRVYVFLGLTSLSNTRTVEMYDKRVGDWKDVRLKGQLEMFIATNCLAAIAKGKEDKIILWSVFMNEKSTYFEFTVDEAGGLTGAAKPAHGKMPNAGTQTPMFWSEHRQAVVTYDYGSRDVWEIKESGMQKFVF